jgi:two-component system sensor histidine kinase KdpD
LKALKNFFLHKPAKKRQYLISLVLVCAVSTLGLFVLDLVGYRVVAFMLLVTVSVLAMFLDIMPVLLAALLSALTWDFFFIPPRYTFTVGSPEDRLLLLMYFLIALINAVLTNKVRQMEKEGRIRDEKANSIKFYNTIFNSLSHEMRTPITTIIGATDNLQLNISKLSEGDKTELLKEISIAAMRLNLQVENLLSMSRLESGIFKIKKDWCDINELVHKTLYSLDSNLHHYKVVVDLKDNLPLVKLDFGIMEQVLYNLILNASLHTPEDTCITIQASYESPRLIIVIADNGKGFPQKEIDHVFEKFYRLKGTSSNGTGLGLSIVKGFVEAHHGTVRLENLPVRGAKFTIEIPTEAADAKSPEK